MTKEYVETHERIRFYIWLLEQYFILRLVQVWLNAYVHRYVIKHIRIHSFLGWVHFLRLDPEYRIEEDINQENFANT